MKLERAPATLPLTREQFIAQILTITGDTRLFWLPKNTDTTTSIDESLNARVITYDATIAAQFSKVGLGDAVSFNGTSDYGTVPDAANLSFGTGVADIAFSLVTLAKVTDTAAVRTIMAKRNTSALAREWEWHIATNDTLVLGLYDESVDLEPFRQSNAAITQGTWKLFGASYDGTGGATAADGIILYQDGLSLASTATNMALYVAMEDTTGQLTIGVRNAATNDALMSGDMAMNLIVAKVLTASEMWAIYQTCRGYFNL